MDILKANKVTPKQIADLLTAIYLENYDPAFEDVYQIYRDEQLGRSKYLNCPDCPRNFKHDNYPYINNVNVSVKNLLTQESLTYSMSIPHLLMYHTVDDAIDEGLDLEKLLSMFTIHPAQNMSYLKVDTVREKSNHKNQKLQRQRDRQIKYDKYI